MIEQGIKTGDFDSWAESNLYRLARMYETCRGAPDYSTVDASHVLYFVQVVRSIASIEDTMKMLNIFIKCQFKDSIV
jgi:hypothetical protein